MGRTGELPELVVLAQAMQPKPTPPDPSLTKNADIGKGADEELVNQELTIVKWEEGVSDVNFHNIYTPPDLRIKVPKSEYQTIYERALLFFCPRAAIK